MQDPILDSNTPLPSQDYNPIIIWWEKKRILFNILVGLTGLLSLIFWANTISIFEVIGSILWALVANLLYSVGPLLEIWNLYYLNNLFYLKSMRWVFFIIGTGAYCLVSYNFVQMMYY